MTKYKRNKGKIKITTETTDQRMDEYGWKPTGRKFGKGRNRQRRPCLLEDPHKNEQNRQSSETAGSKCAQFPTCYGK